MLNAFNLLEIFWDYDIIVTIDILGYYPALGLYSAGQSINLDQNEGFLAADMTRGGTRCASSPPDPSQIFGTTNSSAISTYP